MKYNEDQADQLNVLVVSYLMGADIAETYGERKHQHKCKSPFISNKDSLLRG